MAGGAEGFSRAASKKSQENHQLLAATIPSRMSQLPSHHTISGSHNELVMSSRPPRLQQACGNGKVAKVAAATTVERPVTPVPVLDPVHRQKIIQLRLQAAKASLKRQRGLRRKLSKSFLIRLPNIESGLFVFPSTRRECTPARILVAKDIPLVGRHLQLDCMARFLLITLFIFII